MPENNVLKGTGAGSGIPAGQGAAAAPAKQRENATAEETDARDQRIAELQREFRDGAYQPDPAGVSRAIVDKTLRK